MAVRPASVAAVSIGDAYERLGDGSIPETRATRKPRRPFRSGQRHGHCQGPVMGPTTHSAAAQGLAGPAFAPPHAAGGSKRQSAQDKATTCAAPLLLHFPFRHYRTISRPKWIRLGLAALAGEGNRLGSDLAPGTERPPTSFTVHEVGLLWLGVQVEGLRPALRAFDGYRHWLVSFDHFEIASWKTGFELGIHCGRIDGQSRTPTHRLGILASIKRSISDPRAPFQRWRSSPASWRKDC